MTENELNNAENAENNPSEGKTENNVEATINENNSSNEATKDSSSNTAVDALLDQVNELKDKYLRLQAEFDNFKKRTAKERMELIGTANRDTVVSLLDVLDDADRAEATMASATDVAVVKEGVQLVFNKLRKTLESKGVKYMEVAADAPFDVELHEAITEVPAPGKEGLVVDVVQKGYYLAEKLIRFAKVVIGKQKDA